MKRTIAITLAALALTLSMAACGAKNDRTVSNSSTGAVTNSDGRNQNSGSNSNVKADSNTRENNENTRDVRTGSDSGFMHDMEDAVDDAGNAIGDVGRAVGDAGRAVGDTITGNNGNVGTGMAGGR